MSKDNLWRIIDGISQDIRFAKRALNLFKAVSQNFETIAEDKKDMARMIYDLTFSEVLLSLGRVYDTSKAKKYPVKSIYRLYDIAKKDDYALPLESVEEIKYNYGDFNFPASHIDLLNQNNEFQFRMCMIVYFKHQEINSLLGEAIRKLKYLRDKHAAHNEDMDREIDVLLTYEYSDLLFRTC